MEKFNKIFVAMLITTGAMMGANAAVTITPLSGGSTSGLSVASSGGNRAGGPTRIVAPIRLGSVGTADSGSDSASSNVQRAGSVNTIGKYLGSTANRLRPGSTIKIPVSSGGNIDLSNYVTQEQYDYLENKVDGLELNVDLTDYYTIPETDDLLDEKLFRDDLIGGDNITITDNQDGTKTISAEVSGGTKGDSGDDGREILLRNNGTQIQWQYEGDGLLWNNLVALSDLTGASGAAGAAGANGKEVEMQYNTTTGYLQWRLAGDIEWENLVDLDSLVGSVDVSGKADKVASATDGNLAGLDEDGNLADSGVAADDVLVMPTASELAAGIGSYVMTAVKDGAGNVSGPTYIPVY
ncbi:MAG: hypothetical protein LBL75_00050 [Rickettsiales bacterium]|jgi:hypothetical protein|nr:hypothetical protein [Rickettsiales bacterium]